MRVKAILTIVISLLIGFVLGYFTEVQIVKKERNRYHRRPYSQVFEERMMTIIEPTDEQKSQILPIIKTYAQKMTELRNNTSENYRQLRSQLNTDLQPYLTPEQYKRLTERHRESARGRSDRDSLKDTVQYIDSPIKPILKDSINDRIKP